MDAATEKKGENCQRTGHSLLNRQGQSLAHPPRILLSKLRSEHHSLEKVTPDFALELLVTMAPAALHCQGTKCMMSDHQPSRLLSIGAPNIH